MGAWMGLALVLLASRPPPAWQCRILDAHAPAPSLHLLPFSGHAVALPVYFATGSRMRGFLTAFISGLAEPAAVLVLALVLPFGQLPKEWVDACLAGVGEERLRGGVGYWCWCCRLGSCSRSGCMPVWRAGGCMWSTRATIVGWPVQCSVGRSEAPARPKLSLHTAVRPAVPAGGIMAFLSFHELIPLSITHAGRHAAGTAWASRHTAAAVTALQAACCHPDACAAAHALCTARLQQSSVLLCPAVASLMCGMALMSFNLFLVNNYLLPGGHGH